VRFRLSSKRQRQNLESAGEDLCRRIFKSKGENLNFITPDSLLGVSASCQSWQDLFNQAFFDCSLKEGPDLLKALQENAKKETSYIPVW